MKTYGLGQEDEVPIIKIWLDGEILQCNQNFQKHSERGIQNSKRPIFKIK